jgi:phosphoribosylanthranilate isomerase
MLKKKIQIKVCGITDISEIQALIKMKVDYAGFIFAPSPRRINMETARKLARLADGRLRIVGVFTDLDPEFINGLYDDGIIDIAQLHSPELGRAYEIEAPVWVSVTSPVGYSDAMYPYAKGIHLDTYDKKLKGGTGRTFNWKNAEGIRTEKILILAGGLSYKNIREALRFIKADVVDLNSGAEITNDGIRKKDPGLIEKFIKEVRDYETQ